MLSLGYLNREKLARYRSRVKNIPSMGMINLGESKVNSFCGYLFYPVTVIRIVIVVKIVVMVGIINVIIVRVGIISTYSI